MTNSKSSDNICVSIITVVFNAENTIERTIESVISQNYKNIDYVIIDGGSTDGTLEILNKYKPYFSSFISETDEGIYNAMNKGLSLAKGDVVGILNADDYLYPDAINKVAESFTDAIDFVYAYMDIQDSKGNKVMTFKPLPYNKMLTKGLTDMGAQHSSIYARKSAYKKLNGFNEKYKIVADHDFMIRLFEQGYKSREIHASLGVVSLGGESDSWRINRELYMLAKSHGMNPVRAFLISLRKMLGAITAKILTLLSPKLASWVRNMIKSRYSVLDK